jgi:hypothetical protein
MQSGFITGSCFEKPFRRPINSNNPLAVEPESENDAPAKVVRQSLAFTSIEAAAPGIMTRICSDVQHV